MDRTVPVTEHRLVAVMPGVRVCACGHRAGDLLEHFGQVAQAFMGCDPLRPWEVRDLARTRGDTQARWQARQDREARLQSFRRINEDWTELDEASA